MRIWYKSIDVNNNNFFLLWTYAVNCVYLQRRQAGLGRRQPGRLGHRCRRWCRYCGTLFIAAVCLMLCFIWYWIRYLIFYQSTFVLYFTKLIYMYAYYDIIYIYIYIYKLLIRIREVGETHQTISIFEMLEWSSLRWCLNDLFVTTPHTYKNTTNKHTFQNSSKNINNDIETFCCGHQHF